MNLYRLIWKNIAANRLRSSLVVSSIFISFFIFGFVFALGGWLSGKLGNGQYNERLIVQSRYQLPLKWNMLEQIQKLDGVDAASVTGNTRLGGHYQDPKNKFLQKAVNARAYVKLESKYLKFDDADVNAWLADRRGALIGRAIADQYGFKKGDTISLISSSQVRKDGQPWVFNIAGIVEPRESKIKSKFLVFHDHYLIESVGDYYDVFWFEIDVKDGFDPSKVARSVDSLFKTTSTATTTQSLASISRQLSSQAGDFFFMAKIIISASFFTLFLIVGSSMYRAIKERSVDLAVLKTLGFRQLELSKLIFKEVLLLVVLGGIPAIILLAFIDKIAYIGKSFPGLYVEPAILAVSLGLMLVFAALISLYPIYKVGKYSIVDALRRA